MSSQQDLITLYQFMPMPQDHPQVSSSPFCAKLEAYLILTRRPYATAAGSVPSAPTKSVPYVAYRGKKIGDSQAIIERLEAEEPTSYRPLDTLLSEEQRRVSEEMLDVVENKLYFALVYSRFAMDDGWAHQEAEVRWTLPCMLRCCLPRFIRRSQIEKCEKHGMRDDASAFKLCDAWLARVADVLGGKQFLLGDAPCVADCSLWGHLVIASANVNENPLTAAIRKNKRLMDFMERMTALLKKA